ncbi:hypothetical protein [Paenibacillus harenae]|uniref:hypothetical protein n=1 Tax=Paenibacillus harenae TaxID=306543 RepID=UPI0012EC047A|nr:hypothetical protein [Paenibacillus harenae]
MYQAGLHPGSPAFIFNAIISTFAVERAIFLALPDRSILLSYVSRRGYVGFYQSKVILLSNGFVYCYSSIEQKL